MRARIEEQRREMQSELDRQKLEMQVELDRKKLEMEADFDAKKREMPSGLDDGQSGEVEAAAPTEGALALSQVCTCIILFSSMYSFVDFCLNHPRVAFLVVEQRHSSATRGPPLEVPSQIPCGQPMVSYCRLRVPVGFVW